MNARDELSERIKGEISHHISPVIGWLRLDAAKGVADNDAKRHDAWLERLDKAAESIAEMVKPRTIMTQERIEAAAEAISDVNGAENVAQLALAAADAHDAANGVHRVSLDDEGMKRALEAVDTFTELVYDSFAGKERDDLVRAIVRAATVKEEQ